MNTTGALVKPKGIDLGGRWHWGSRPEPDAAFHPHHVCIALYHFLRDRMLDLATDQDKSSILGARRYGARATGAAPGISSM
ncbi:hypothetical protein Tco_1318486 [Tanacetum coccineum]